MLLRESRRFLPAKQTNPSLAVALVRLATGAQAEREVGASRPTEEEAAHGRPLYSEDQEELQQHRQRPQHGEGPRRGRTDRPQGLPQVSHHVQEDNTASEGTRLQTHPVLRLGIVPPDELREGFLEVSGLQVSLNQTNQERPNLIDLIAANRHSWKAWRWTSTCGVS